MEQLEVKFWGTRGSCPADFVDREAFGGNTSCVSVKWENGLAIFDCGSGMMALGQWLLKERMEGRFTDDMPIHIFISHQHLDHIIGLPVFIPLFWKDATIHLYGAAGSGATFRERMEGVICPPYWPIGLAQVTANLVWHEVLEKDMWEIGRTPAGSSVQVRFMRSDHPNDCVLYRLDACGQSVVYGLDCESTEAIWETYRRFSESCSLLIFDAAYTEQEYEVVRGFGHSYWQKGVELANQCHTKRLALCHHDWKCTDLELYERSKELHSVVNGSKLWAEFIKEGCTILLGQAE